MKSEGTGTDQIREERWRIKNNRPSRNRNNIVPDNLGHVCTLPSDRNRER